MQSHLYFDDKHASQPGREKILLLKKFLLVKVHHRDYTALTLMVPIQSGFTKCKLYDS